MSWRDGLWENDKPKRKRKNKIRFSHSFWTRIKTHVLFEFGLKLGTWETWSKNGQKPLRRNGQRVILCQKTNISHFFFKCLISYDGYIVYLPIFTWATTFKTPLLSLVDFLFMPIRNDTNPERFSRNERIKRISLQHSLLFTQGPICNYYCPCKNDLIFFVLGGSVPISRCIIIVLCATKTGRLPIFFLKWPNGGDVSMVIT